MNFFIKLTSKVINKGLLKLAYKEQGSVSS